MKEQFNQKRFDELMVMRDLSCRDYLNEEGTKELICRAFNELLMMRRIILGEELDGSEY